MQYDCPLCRKTMAKADLVMLDMNAEAKPDGENDGVCGSDCTADSTENTTILSKYSTSLSVNAKVIPHRLFFVSSIHLCWGELCSMQVNYLLHRLLQLKAEGKGTKSLVFTQFNPLIKILSNAFRAHGLKFVSFVGECIFYFSSCSCLLTVFLGNFIFLCVHINFRRRITNQTHCCNRNVSDWWRCAGLPDVHKVGRVRVDSYCCHQGTFPCHVFARSIWRCTL